MAENYVKEHWLYHVGKIICIPFSKIMYRFKIIGKENLPKEGAIIIASNHISLFDPVAIALAFKRPVHFMGKAELFSNKFMGFFIKNFNCFPVNRGTGDANAIDLANHVIEEKMVLGIFPEGTRSKDEGKPSKRAKSGLAMLVQKNKCDVLPVAVITTGKPKFFQKYTLRVGEVIKYEDLGFTTDEINRAEIKNASNLMWLQVLNLWEQGHDN